MSSEGGEPLNDIKQKHHGRRQKKNDYTIETPLYGRIKGVEFFNILSQALHELEGEIRGVRNGRSTNIMMRSAQEGSPTTSFYV